jgi:hypothetical protein
MIRKSVMRRGVLTAEAIIVLSLLFLITFAIIEFGLLLSLQQSVTLAAMQAAREAGQGQNLAEISDTVDEILAPHCIAIGADASVRLEDPATATDDKAGTPTCPDPPTSPPITIGDVRVTVCVATDSLAVFGMLDDFGFPLDCLLRRSAVVKRERAPLLP